MFASSLLQNFSTILTGQKKTSPRNQAALLYSQLMHQARNAWFYSEARIPDSFDGRFEMLILHLFSYLETCKNNPEKAPLRQALLEFMLDDMDRTLREMSVGDMGVSRRIKHMASAMHGRFTVYAQAMADSSPAALEEALRRNAYGTIETDSIPAEAVAKLANYTTRITEYLATQSEDDLKLKEFTFYSHS